MAAAERSRAEAPGRMCMDAPGIASMVLDSSAQCGQTVRVDTFTVSFEAGHVAQDCGSSGTPGSSSRFARRRADERVTDRGCGRAMVAARQAPKKTVHAYGGAPEVLLRGGAVAPLHGPARRTPRGAKARPHGAVTERRYHGRALNDAGSLRGMAGTPRRPRRVAGSGERRSPAARWVREMGGGVLRSSIAYAPRRRR